VQTAHFFCLYLFTYALLYYSLYTMGHKKAANLFLSVTSSKTNGF